MLRPIRIVAVIIAILFLRTPTFSQTPARVNASQTFEFSFPGGTVSDFVNLLRSKDPEIQILLDPSAESVIVPKVTVAKLSTGHAINLMQALTSGFVKVDTITTSQEFGGGATVLWRIKGPTPVSVVPKLAVFNVGRLLDADRIAEPKTEGSSQAKLSNPDRDARSKSNLADILKAIELALDMIDQKAPEMKLHAETGILMVKGSSKQIETVRQVIEEISRSPLPETQSNSPAAEGTATNFNTVDEAVGIYIRLIDEGKLADASRIATQASAQFPNSHASTLMVLHSQLSNHVANPNLSGLQLRITPPLTQADRELLEERNKNLRPKQSPAVPK